MSLPGRAGNASSGSIEPRRRRACYLDSLPASHPVPARDTEATRTRRARDPPSPLKRQPCEASNDAQISRWGRGAATAVLYPEEGPRWQSCTIWLWPARPFPVSQGRLRRRFDMALRAAGSLFFHAQPLRAGAGLAHQEEMWRWASWRSSSHAVPGPASRCRSTSATSRWLEPETTSAT